MEKSGLCVLGRPYRTPGPEPVVYNFLYRASEIKLSSFSFFRKLLILSCILSENLKIGSDISENLSQEVREAVFREYYHKDMVPQKKVRKDYEN